MRWLLQSSLQTLRVSRITHHAGTHYLKVFQVVGTLAYAGNAATPAIWFRHAWGKTIKGTLDGLVYRLLMAGIFGWLWP